LLSVLAIGPAAAAPPKAPPGPALVALAPPPGDDARRAIAIGPAGEAYEFDGKGAWVRRQRFTTADRLGVAGRAGAHVLAAGEGTIYRLATNGWSALRLAQKGKAVMSSGPRAVGAVGRQLYALDQLAGGEPAKLVVAPASVTALGSGKTLVIQTERGLLRLAGMKLAPIKKAPKQVTRLVGDRWALVDRGVVDLATGARTTWPAGLAVPVAAVGPAESFVGVATTRSTVELVTLVKGKLTRAPVEVASGGVPVGLVIDKAGRVVIALRDGRVVVRDRGAWTVVAVTEELAAPRPGAPPAESP
ncbi:MAG: hypothetical protein M3680_35275, partial [Myxococcota bacterium]|nr:hypothetical protein [Myxococcota bacterium]